MKPKEIIKSYYDSHSMEDARDYERLGWESEEAHFKRFKVLTDNLDLNGRSILDVGCGLGNLLQHLKNEGIAAKYTGVDLLESMIKQAKGRYPQEEFMVADVFEPEALDGRKFDVVFTSGIFNLNLKNNMKFLEKALNRFMELSAGFVAFNLLHINSNDKAPTYFFYDPDKVAGIIAGLHIKPKSSRFIDDYLQHNDFTVILSLH